MSFLKITGLAVAGLVMTAALGAGAWLGAQTLLCDARVEREIPAPGGKLRAVLFSRSCAFDNSPNFQLSLMEAGSRVRDYDTGNVFVSDRDFNFTWKNATELTVEGLGGSFVVKETFYGHHVEHRE